MEDGEDRIDGLIRIVGRERACHPPELVTAAEREIIRRLGGTRKQVLRRLRFRAVFIIALGIVQPIGVLIIGSSRLRVRGLEKM